MFGQGYQQTCSKEDNYKQKYTNNFIGLRNLRCMHEFISRLEIINNGVREKEANH